MAKILPDKEIRKLLNNAIIGGSPECVSSNSYSLRLGTKVKFDSTGEEMEIPPGCFLEIQPGDFVTVASLEKLDFSQEALSSMAKIGPLAGLVTPTTTMMREGFLFTTTKVDPGFRGVLNWGIRNSSIKSVKLKHGERLFKLTLFELEEDEAPDKLYGEDEKDHYQDSEGIVPSARMIPADIPEKQIIRRTERRVDPTKQLIEAGYPFSHIGTELVNLHGKFEVVSKDVLLLKQEFGKMQSSLERKIDAETNTLASKLSELSESLTKKMKDFFTEQFETLFERKKYRILGSLATVVSFGIAGYNFVLKSTPVQYQGWVFLIIGIILLLLTFLLTKK